MRSEKLLFVLLHSMVRSFSIYAPAARTSSFVHSLLVANRQLLNFMRGSPHLLHTPEQIQITHFGDPCRQCWAEKWSYQRGIVCSHVRGMLSVSRLLIALALSDRLLQATFRMAKLRSSVCFARGLLPEMTSDAVTPAHVATI